MVISVLYEKTISPQQLTKQYPSTETCIRTLVARWWYCGSEGWFLPFPPPSPRLFLLSHLNIPSFITLLLLLVKHCATFIYLRPMAWLNFSEWLSPSTWLCLLENIAWFVGSRDRLLACSIFHLFQLEFVFNKFTKRNYIVDFALLFELNMVEQRSRGFERTLVLKTALSFGRIYECLYLNICYNHYK